MSSEEIFKSHIFLHRIQSTPFSFFDLAHPGLPIIEICFFEISISASRIKFPGSTGIPKRKILPLISSIDLGIVSFMSDIADVPNIKIISASSLTLFFKCSQMDLISW